MAGLLSADIIELTGYFPTNLAPPYVLSATLALEEGGVVEAGLIGKHDCARSEIRFNGGTLRTLKDTTSLFTGQGIVDLVIADNTGAVFDTNGKTAVITPGVSPEFVCAARPMRRRWHGGLVKRRGHAGGPTAAFMHAVGAVTVSRACWIWGVTGRAPDGDGLGGAFVVRDAATRKNHLPRTRG